MIKALIYTLISLFIIPVTAEAALYRWVDSKGKVHYSDQVPPEDAGQERKVMDRSGRTLDVIERSKTEEELRELKRLKKIREEEKRQQELQASRDRVLLLTYQSEQEIVAARDTRLSTIELAKDHARESLAAQRQRLSEIRHKAAEFERSSRPIPASVIDEMSAQQTQIEKTMAYINTREHEQEQIRNEFAAYIERYRELTN